MSPGTIVGVLLFIFAPVLFTAVGALYPTAGFLVLWCLSAVIGLIQDQGIAGVLIYLVAVVWHFVPLGFGLALERVLDERLWHRRLRHVARFLLIGFIVHVLAFGFFQEFNPATSFFERLTVLHGLIVSLGCVGAHFFSSKFDAGLRNRVADHIPGMAWALHRFNPRRKANEAALASMEERMHRRTKP